MEKNRYRVINSRLGSQRISEGRVVRFPLGLIGFEKSKDFVLIQVKSDSPFVLLQSMDKPSLGFLVADPFAFLQDYQVRIGTAEQSLLRVNSLRDLAILVTVGIPKGEPQNTTLNLTGPILINTEFRIGLQVPQADLKGPSRVNLSKVKPCRNPKYQALL